MSLVLIGTVSSDKSDKTIAVKVVTDKIHPIYKKRYSSSKRYLAHDAKNEAKVGDKVAIVETRPMSARKHFELKEIVEKAPVKHEEEPEPKAEEASK